MRPVFFISSVPHLQLLPFSAPSHLPHLICPISSAPSHLPHLICPLPPAPSHLPSLITQLEEELRVEREIAESTGRAAHAESRRRVEAENEVGARQREVERLRKELQDALDKQEDDEAAFQSEIAELEKELHAERKLAENNGQMAQAEYERRATAEIDVATLQETLDAVLEEQWKREEDFRTEIAKLEEKLYAEREAAVGMERMAHAETECRAAAERVVAALRREVECLRKDLSEALDKQMNDEEEYQSEVGSGCDGCGMGVGWVGGWVWDGCGMGVMGVGWVWNGFGMGVGWVWDGCGMGVGRVCDGCGMAVGWVWDGCGMGVGWVCDGCGMVVGWVGGWVWDGFGMGEGWVGGWVWDGCGMGVMGAGWVWDGDGTVVRSWWDWYGTGVGCDDEAPMARLDGCLSRTQVWWDFRISCEGEFRETGGGCICHVLLSHLLPHCLLPFWFFPYLKLFLSLFLSDSADVVQDCCTAGADGEEEGADEAG
ncbi:unnamed protein product [Closterium sp. Yama58-4]|nr:unnamed protein product [Closterium sp. Yama58-4]